MAQKKNQILAMTSEADRRPNSARMPLLFMDVGGIVALPGVYRDCGVASRARRREPAESGESKSVELLVKYEEVSDGWRFERVSEEM